MNILPNTHRYFLFFIFLFSSQCLFSQENLWFKPIGVESYVKTRKKDENLKGPISSVLTKRYYAKDVYGVIKTGRSAAQNWLNSKCVFDSNGFLEKQISYDTAGRVVSISSYKYNQRRLVGFSEIIDKTTTYEHEFSYNINGDKISESFYLKGKELSRSIYDYNDKKQVIRKSEYGKTGELTSRTLYEYDELKNIKTETIKNRNGVVVRTIRYTYDVNGNIIEELIINDDYTQKTIYKYDYWGREISYELDNPTWYSSYMSEYNDFNDLKLQENVTRSGYIGERTTYEYTYDKNNNWIQRIEYKNDIAKMITIRVITYFN